MPDPILKIIMISLGSVQMAAIKDALGIDGVNAQRAVSEAAPDFAAAIRNRASAR